MGKVIRSDRTGVQRIRARDIVPGDIVEVAGMMGASSFHYVTLVTPSLSMLLPFWPYMQRGWLSDPSKALWPKARWTEETAGQGAGST